MAKDDLTREEITILLQIVKKAPISGSLETLPKILTKVAVIATKLEKRLNELPAAEPAQAPKET